MKKLRTYISPRFDETILKRRNRRRMAWVSLIGMLSIVFLLMFFVPENRISELVPIIDTVLVCLSGVVGAYLGTALLDDNNIMKVHSNHAKATVETNPKPKKDDDEAEEESEEEAIEKGPARKK